MNKKFIVLLAIPVVVFPLFLVYVGANALNASFAKFTGDMERRINLHTGRCKSSLDEAIQAFKGQSIDEEDLAPIKRAFDTVQQCNERINDLNQQYEALYADDIVLKEEIGSKIKSQAEKLEQVFLRLDRLQNIEDRLGGTSDQLTLLEARIQFIGAELNDCLRESDIDDCDNSVDSISETITLLKSTQKDIEANLDINNTESSITTLKSEMVELKDALEDVVQSSEDNLDILVDKNEKLEAKNKRLLTWYLNSPQMLGQTIEFKAADPEIGCDQYSAVGTLYGARVTPEPTYTLVHIGIDSVALKGICLGGRFNCPLFEFRANEAGQDKKARFKVLANFEVSSTTGRAGVCTAALPNDPHLQQLKAFLRSARASGMYRFDVHIALNNINKSKFELSL